MNGYEAYSKMQKLTAEVARDTAKQIAARGAWEHDTIKIVVFDALATAFRDFADTMDLDRD